MISDSTNSSTQQQQQHQQSSETNTTITRKKTFAAVVEAVHSNAISLTNTILEEVSDKEIISAIPFRPTINPANEMVHTHLNPAHTPIFGELRNSHGSAQLSGDKTFTAFNYRLTDSTAYELFDADTPLLIKEKNPDNNPIRIPRRATNDATDMVSLRTLKTYSPTVNYFSEPTFIYNQSPAMTSAKSLARTSDLTQFPSQVNMNGPHFNAMVTGTYLNNLPDKANLAEFNPWFNYFCNVHNYAPGTIGNFVNAVYPGTIDTNRDDNGRPDVCVKNRGGTVEIQYATTTLGNYMRAANGHINVAIEQFDLVIPVNLSCGLSTLHLEALLLCLIPSDPFMYFCRSGTIRDKDANIISNNMYKVNLSYDLMTFNFDEYRILFVDVSDHSLGYSKFVGRNIQQSVFFQQAHDFANGGYALSADVFTEYCVAVATFVDRPDAALLVSSAYEWIADLFPNKLAHDTALGAALHVKTRIPLPAVLMADNLNAINSSTITGAPNVTPFWRLNNISISHYHADASFLNGQRMSEGIQLQIISPDWPILVGVAAKLLYSPHTFDLKYKAYDTNTLLTYFNKVACYIAWTFDNYMEYNGFTSRQLLARQDQSGHVSVALSVLMKSIYLIYDNSRPLTTAPSNADWNSGRQALTTTFTVFDSQCLPATRTPSDLFSTSSKSKGINLATRKQSIAEKLGEVLANTGQVKLVPTRITNYTITRWTGETFPNRLTCRGQTAIYNDVPAKILGNINSFMMFNANFDTRERQINNIEYNFNNTVWQRDFVSYVRGMPGFDGTGKIEWLTSVNTVNRAITDFNVFINDLDDGYQPIQNYVDDYSTQWTARISDILNM